VRSKNTQHQTEPDLSGAIRTLIQRLSFGPHADVTRIIAFMAARPREGTSTIARDYAEALAAETGQKVLLLDARALTTQRFRSFGTDPNAGPIDAIIAGYLPAPAARSAGRNVEVGNWIGRSEKDGLPATVFNNPRVWDTLLLSFDTIIIDAPSLQSSFDGIPLAARADATILVVEAETTPQPVVQNLRDVLAASGAKLAGVVLNKRRRYIPSRVYKKL
jgi:protein-tyrosine kinase